MSAKRVLSLESMSRSIAVWGSVTAAVIFALGFAQDKRLTNSLMYLETINVSNGGVLLYLCLLVGVFACYLIAAKRKFEASGSLLALAAVGSVYGWCRFGLHINLGPSMLVLAFPALFHLLAVTLQRLPANGDEVAAESDMLPAAA